MTFGGDEASLRVVAGHEAAHATAALSLGMDIYEVRVWREPGGAIGGHFRDQEVVAQVDPSYGELSTALRHDPAHREKTFNKMVMKLSGLAQDLGAGVAVESAMYNSTNDREWAAFEARNVSFNEAAARREMHAALFSAAAIVDREHGPIIALGAELAARGRLGRDDILRTLRGAGYPSPARVPLVLGPATDAITATGALDWLCYAYLPPVDIGDPRWWGREG
jgi:hypothetical protein